MMTRSSCPIIPLRNQYMPHTAFLRYAPSDSTIPFVAHYCLLLRSTPCTCFFGRMVKADHGSFRHEFSYRTLPPAAMAPPRPSPGRAGGSNTGERPPTDARRGCGAPTPGDGGMFAAQALLPGEMGVLSRARGVVPAVKVGEMGAVEGHGGGTVTGGDGEVGSASAVRRP